MHKSKKNTSKKRHKICTYTDEAKRILKITKKIRQKNRKLFKTMKNLK